LLLVDDDNYRPTAAVPTILPGFFAKTKNERTTADAKNIEVQMHEKHERDKLRSRRLAFTVPKALTFVNESTAAHSLPLSQPEQLVLVLVATCGRQQQERRNGSHEIMYDTTNKK
jgi:hypothetical protein